MMNHLKSLAIFTGLMLMFSLPIFAQVAINDDGTPPAASAMLDINSPNRGFLPPRLTLTAANLPDPVTAPAPGLLVYNTQSNGEEPNKVIAGYYSWSGSRWIPVSPPTGINPGDMAFWNGSFWQIIPAGGYGESLVFCNGVPTWGGCVPQVSTYPVTNILPNSAQSGGIVTSDGGSPVTARGICWDTIPNPTLSASHSIDGTGPGSFDSSIAGLIQNKAYYVRAYATNARGTAYGLQNTFSTGPTFISVWKP